jgi:hypothetical protein
VLRNRLPGSFSNVAVWPTIRLSPARNPSYRFRCAGRTALATAAVAACARRATYSTEKDTSSDKRLIQLARGKKLARNKDESKPSVCEGSK